MTASYIKSSYKSNYKYSYRVLFVVDRYSGKYKYSQVDCKRNSDLFIKMIGSSDRIWFSQYFDLEDPQFKLPFVDFNLNGDVPLYIDPYAITKDSSDLAVACHNCLVSYFQALLDAIRSGNRTQIKRLL